MSRNTTRTGPATRAELHRLHAALLRALLDATKAPSPTAADLAVARAFLVDNGLPGPTVSRKARAKLQRLFGLLVDRLAEALEPVSDAPAAMHAQAVALLKAAGVVRDAGEARDVAAALRELKATELPFLQ